MASTDYSGQEFNVVVFNSSLDDSEISQLLNSVDFNSDFDDSDPGELRDVAQHQSDYLATGGGGITTYYAMRAIDPDCLTLTYVSWVVTGSPDTIGSQYIGPRCGGSPLTDITIAAKWQV